MKPELNIKKIVSKKDWKQFNVWIKDNDIFFNSNSFFTDLLNINLNNKYAKSLWEFHFFNQKILDNSYTFLEDYVLQEESNLYNKNDEILDFFLKIFVHKNINLKNEWNILFNFLKNLEVYLQVKNKDYEQEFLVVQDYWDFLNTLFEEEVKNFNLLILYINKHVYKKAKGFL